MHMRAAPTNLAPADYQRTRRGGRVALLAYRSVCEAGVVLANDVQPTRVRRQGVPPLFRDDSGPLLGGNVNLK